MFDKYMGRSKSLSKVRTRVNRYRSISNNVGKKIDSYFNSEDNNKL